MRQHIVFTGLAVTLLVGSTASAPASAADAADSENVVLSGSVLTKNQAQQADLALVAWPNSEVLAAQPEGAVVDTKVVATSTTDPSGQFSLSLDPAVVPSTYRGPDGQVDLEVVATTSDQQAIWNTSVVRAEELNSGAIRGWRTQTTLEATQPGTVRMDLGRRTITNGDIPASDDESSDGTQTAATDSGRPTLAVVSRAAASSKGYAAAAVQPLAPIIPNCSFNAGPWVNNRPETFAAVYAWSGAKATVKFSTASVHSLGIGLGFGTAWSYMGEKAVTTGDDATASNVVDAYAVNKVNYRDYINSCNHSFRQRRPINFYALLPGAESTYARHVNFSHCSPYVPGQTITKNRGTNVTYDAGVNIGPINVKAQSGWNNGTELTWNVTRNSWYCGSSAQGPAASQEVDVRAR